MAPERCLCANPCNWWIWYVVWQEGNKDGIKVVNQLTLIKLSWVIWVDPI